MCDLTPVRNWLIATVVAIFAAVAIIIGAAIANASWWLAWTAPIGMAFAAAATGLAMLFCGFAKSALDAFCKCAAKSPACASPCSSLGNVLAAAITVLGIQATACLWAALAAWIPGAGQFLMWIIIGSLVIQAALILSAIVFLNQLSTCQTSAPPVPPVPSGPPKPPTAPRG